MVDRLYWISWLGPRAPSQDWGPCSQLCDRYLLRRHTEIFPNLCWKQKEAVSPRAHSPLESGYVCSFWLLWRTDKASCYLRSIIQASKLSMRFMVPSSLHILWPSPPLFSSPNMCFFGHFTKTFQEANIHICGELEAKCFPRETTPGWIDLVSKSQMLPNGKHRGQTWHHRIDSSV